MYPVVCKSQLNIQELFKTKILTFFTFVVGYSDQTISRKCCRNSIRFFTSV